MSAAFDMAAYQVAYRAAHREAYRAAAARWRARNPGKVAARNREWYASHREEKLAYDAAHRDRDRAHYAEHREDKRKYAAEHREELNAYHHARRRSYDRARSGDETRALLAVGECFYCGVRPDRLTADHFYPVAWLKRCPERLPAGMDRTNIDAIDNIRPACRPCNERKQARDPHEFMTAPAVLAA